MKNFFCKNQLMWLNFLLGQAVVMTLACMFAQPAFALTQTITDGNVESSSNISNVVNANGDSSSYSTRVETSVNGQTQVFEQSGTGTGDITNFVSVKSNTASGSQSQVQVRLGAATVSPSTFTRPPAKPAPAIVKPNYLATASTSSSTPTQVLKPERRFMDYLAPSFNWLKRIFSSAGRLFNLF